MRQGDHVSGEREGDMTGKKQDKSGSVRTHGSMEQNQDV